MRNKKWKVCTVRTVYFFAFFLIALEKCYAMEHEEKGGSKKILKGFKPSKPITWRPLPKEYSFLKQAMLFDEELGMYYCGKKLSTLSRPQKSLSASVVENGEVVIYSLPPSKKPSSGHNSSSPPSPLPKAPKKFLHLNKQWKKVENPGEYPWCVHGLLYLNYGGATYIGSGTLIRNRYVLTAAHNFCDHRKAPADEVIFFTGINGEITLGSSGYAEVQQVAIHPTWLTERGEESKKRYDLAVMKLKKPLGKELGSFQVSAVKEEELKKIQVNIAGRLGMGQEYGRFLYTTKITIQKVEKGCLFYENITYQGQSGGALWKEENSEPSVCGIHGYENKDKNNSSGVFIDQENLSNIDKWIQRLEELGKKETSTLEEENRNSLSSLRKTSSFLDKGKEKVEESSEESEESDGERSDGLGDKSKGKQNPGNSTSGLVKKRVNGWEKIARESSSSSISSEAASSESKGKKNPSSSSSPKGNNSKTRRNILIGAVAGGVGGMAAGAATGGTVGATVAGIPGAFVGGGAGGGMIGGVAGLAAGAGTAAAVTRAAGSGLNTASKSAPAKKKKK